MKFKEQFRKAHPDTVGETDYAFDLCNYADWLDNEYDELLQQRDELRGLLKRFVDVFYEDKWLWENMFIEAEAAIKNIDG